MKTIFRIVGVVFSCKFSKILNSKVDFPLDVGPLIIKLKGCINFKSSDWTAISRPLDVFVKVCFSWLPGSLFHRIGED